jgi:hypothetical protein
MMPQLKACYDDVFVKECYFENRFRSKSVYFHYSNTRVAVLRKSQANNDIRRVHKIVKSIC